MLNQIQFYIVFFEKMCAYIITKKAKCKIISNHENIFFHFHVLSKLRHKLLQKMGPYTNLSLSKVSEVTY